VRGFAVGQQINGARAANSFSDTATTQQIEIVKGPNSILYGLVQPGGLINTITKRPLWTQQGSVSFAYGDYSYYQAGVDVTGPISDKVAYRVIGSWTDRDYFQDWKHTERSVMAPSVTFKPNEKVTINMMYERLDLDTIPDNGIPIIWSSAEFRSANPDIFVLNPSKEVAGRKFSVQGPNGFVNTNQHLFQTQITAQISDNLIYNGHYHYFSKYTDGRHRRSESWFPWAGLPTVDAARPQVQVIDDKSRREEIRNEFLTSF
jgi:outer membrane receptor protein involved in Fe transport